MILSSENECTFWNNDSDWKPKVSLDEISAELEGRELDVPKHSNNFNNWNQWKHNFS